PKLAEEAPGLALGRNRLVFVQQSIEPVSSIFTRMRGQRLNCLYPFSRIMSSIDCWVFFCKRPKILVKTAFLQAPSLGAGFLTYIELEITELEYETHEVY
ncbi:hypothetical protein KGY79_11975, partial [Candidatus Bipolaricaulota bacterium]|nr:hypothetical protein [Candidatus Bipolaricaulota bacterium]